MLLLSSVEELVLPAGVVSAASLSGTLLVDDDPVDDGAPRVIHDEMVPSRVPESACLLHLPTGAAPSERRLVTLWHGDLRRDL